MKSTWRANDVVERELGSKLGETFMNIMIGIGHENLFRNCLICANFNQDSEQCQVYKARPPARIIVVGCDHFVDKEQIPF